MGFIFGDIDRLNTKLASSIKGILEKTESDKIELSDEFIKKLEEKSEAIGQRIDLVNEPVFKVIAGSEGKIADIKGMVEALGIKVNSLVIPKKVVVKAGKNVTVDTKETDKGIVYTVNSSSKEITHLYNNTIQGGGTGGVTFYAGDNITIQGLTITAVVSGSTYYSGEGIAISGQTISNTLGFVGSNGTSVSLIGNTYTIYSSTSGGGSTVYAGTGIDITGGTITNTLPGVSMQAGFGVAISGVTITNTLPGISLQAGNNITIQGVTISSTASGISLTDNLPEGVSNFYYRADRFVGIGGASVSFIGKTLTIYAQSSGSPAWGDITGSLSAQTDLYAELVTKISGSSTTDLLTQGNSNFYYDPKTFIGTGGVSVSVLGKTVTIYGLSTAIDQSTLGLSAFGEKSYNSLTDTPDLSVYILGSSVIGQYVLGASFHTAVSVVDSTTIDFGISSNQSITGSVLQGGLGLSALGERSYNSLTEKLGFVGTGGVSVSSTGNTFTIFGLSTVVNTNNVTEGASGLFYSSQRFTTDLGTKTTNDLAQGTSNFYYNPQYLQYHHHHHFLLTIQPHHQKHRSHL